MAGCQDWGVAELGQRWVLLRRFLRLRTAMLASLYLLSLSVLFLVWSLVSGHDPNALSESQFSPPSPAFWFGTDVHGRDLFSRTMVGLRISLLVGVCGALVSLAIGTLWGASAAYLGGRWDALLMRTVDVLYAMPSIIFVIVLMATYDGVVSPWVEQGLQVLGGDDQGETASALRLGLLYVGLGAVSWLTVARIVRGEVLALRERTFVLASRVLGASGWRILFRHLLPNLAGVLLVYLTLTIPTIVIYESFLSYLGLGIQPPAASLGSLIAEGAQQMNPIRIYWWMILFPALALVLTLLSLNYVGDGLRHVVNLRVSSETR